MKIIIFVTMIYRYRRTESFKVIPILCCINALSHDLTFTALVIFVLYYNSDILGDGLWIPRLYFHTYSISTWTLFRHGLYFD